MERPKVIALMTKGVLLQKQGAPPEVFPFIPGVVFLFIPRGVPLLLPYRSASVSRSKFIIKQLYLIKAYLTNLKKYFHRIIQVYNRTIFPYTAI